MVERGDRRGPRPRLSDRQRRRAGADLPARRRRLRGDVRRRGRGRAARPRSRSGRRPDLLRGRPTSLLEAYVLDFDGDLYDQPARCASVERLRGQERFDSVDAPGRADARRRRGDPPHLGRSDAPWYRAGCVGTCSARSRIRARRPKLPHARHHGHDRRAPPPRDRHRLDRRSRWRCSPSGSTTSPST